MAIPLPHLFIYLFLPLTFWTPWSLHLLNNYLTFSSTSLSLSPLEFPTSSSPQLIAYAISYLNLVVRFFLVSLYFLWFYCCLSLKGAFFLLWFLCLFFVVIHLGALSCMSLWIKLYRTIVIFVVHFENITCHWEFFTHRAGLRLV